MDIFEIIFMLAAAHGLILGLALLFSKRKANLFLGGLVLIISLGLLTNAVLIPMGYFSTGYELPIWLFYSVLWIPPCFYFYVYFCTNSNKSWKRSYLWVFIPGFIDIVISSVVYIGGTYLGNTIFPYPLFKYLDALVEPLANIATLYVFIHIRNIIRGYHHRIKNQFSDIQSIQLHWLKMLLSLCFVAITIWVIALLADIFIEEQIPLLEFVYEALWLVEGVIIFIIGYKAYSFPEVFRNPTTNEASKSEESYQKEASFSNYDDPSSLEKIHHEMRVHKKYRQAKLSLKDFSHELELPVRYVSYLLNHHLQVTFHDFVNAYRVEEVLQKLSDPAYKQYTLLALGLDAGFNSKSALNYNFKKQTGSSPSAFLKSQSNKSTLPAAEKKKQKSNISSPEK